MTKTVDLTIQAVGALIESAGQIKGDPYDNPWDGWSDNLWNDKYRVRGFFGLGTVEIVDHLIRGEGYADYDGNGSGDSYMVFRVTWNDGTESFYRKNGLYQSYVYESQWTGTFTEVKAKVETKVVYF